MWKMINDDCIVDNEHKEKFFVTVAMISQDEYEDRIEEFFDDISAAKAALAEKFALLKAEDEKLLWHIDEDGNAFSGSHKIHWGTVTKNSHGMGFVVLKELTCAGIECVEVLKYTSTVNDAKDFIRQHVDELNAEES